MARHNTGPVVKNHISSEMARELIAIFPSMYHSLSLVYQRVLPQLHLYLLLHHLHHRIPYLMSTDTPNVNTTQIRNKWDCWKSSSQCKLRGRLQFCCSRVWMKIGGQIPWNAILICETFKISCLMGKHLTKGGAECPSTDQ